VKITESTYLGIVSPCSTCKNQRAFPDPTPNGLKNFCPRRHAQAALTAAMDSGDDTSSLVQIALTGNEDTSNPGSNALANPVNSKGSNSIYVWTALLQDNEAVVDPKTGQVINPSILDPAFNTDYIQCQLLPYVPNCSESDYFHQGRLEEGQHIKVTQIKQQVDLENGERVETAGVVERTGLAFGYTRQSVIKHTSPEGT
jgi:hypothetical protein